MAPEVIAENADWRSFSATFTAFPGDGVLLLVAADWLDENGHGETAEQFRRAAPRLAKQYATATQCLDALLTVDVSGIVPHPMPAPDREGYRSGRQLVGIVRAALRTLTVPGLTVGTVSGWGGPRVQIRLPPAGFVLPTADGTGYPLPWRPTRREMTEAGQLALDRIMRAMFPDEPAVDVHFDGETWQTPRFGVWPFGPADLP